ncbi:MAG: 4-(cytidine 5'-diphospho)-2-C-methyl-D-erythritol kinase [archaeon]
MFQSPAKLNLILDLIRKREDGFHEVDFIMQELELHDTITLESVLENAEILISCDDASVPTDEKNLCYTAAQLLQEECRKQGSVVQGVRIHIEKRIPSAGGMGGGSSNAAAVVKGLNEGWNLDLSKNVLSEIASRIGSDVPFFVYGGTCRAQGKGEIITPLEKCPVLDLAFIVPPVKVPTDKTRWIYGNFDVTNVKNHPSVERFKEVLKSGNPQTVAQAAGNVFENEVAVPEYGAVWFLIEALKTIPGVWNVILAGAGPTVAVVCDSSRTAEMVIAPFRAKGYVSFVTRTV